MPFIGVCAFDDSGAQLLQSQISCNYLSEQLIPIGPCSLYARVIPRYRSVQAVPCDGKASTSGSVGNGTIIPKDVEFEKVEIVSIRKTSVADILELDGVRVDRTVIYL